MNNASVVEWIGESKMTIRPENIDLTSMSLLSNTRKDSGAATGALPVEVVSLVLHLARKEERITLDALADKVEGATRRRLSRVTIANMLRKHGVMRRREFSLLAVIENKILNGDPVGPCQRVKAMESNPALREHGGPGEGRGRGELLTQAMFPLLPGASGELGRWQMHVVVDTWGVAAFADVCQDGRMDAAVDLLHHRVLPWYEEHGVKVMQMETNRSRTYTGDEDHAYGMYLRLRGIRHRVRETARGQTSMNGYMARFKQVFSSEFLLSLRSIALARGRWPEDTRPFGFREADFRRSSSPFDIEIARERLLRWVRRYNASYPLSGYRNNGLSPMKFWRSKSA